MKRCVLFLSIVVISVTATYVNASTADDPVEVVPPILSSLCADSGLRPLEDSEMAELHGTADPALLQKLLLSAIVLNLKCDQLKILVVYLILTAPPPVECPPPQPCPECYPDNGFIPQ